MKNKIENIWYAIITIPTLIFLLVLFVIGWLIKKTLDKILKRESKPLNLGVIDYEEEN